MASTAMAVECVDQALEVLGEPAVAAEPGEGALDDPAAGQQVEAFGVARALDDLEPQSLARRGAAGDLALVAGIGEQVPQPREASADPGADQPRPSRSWMLAGWTTSRSGRPSVSVSRCRLRPLTFLPASKPRGPPASVVLTLWLSMIPAVGEASRPACSRAAMSRVVWIVDQMPSCQNRRK